MSYNPYDQAKKLAEHLRHFGLLNVAKQLEDDVDSATSQIEVFMQMRFHLLPVRDNLLIDIETRLQITRLLLYLEEALTE